LKKVFDAFDRNKNGKIDANELKEALTKLGLTHSDEVIDEAVIIFYFYFTLI